MFHVPEPYRITRGTLGSDKSQGNNGAFLIPNRAPGRARDGLAMLVVASDGEGWEHVSVSMPTRCATWCEMDYIKGLFWDDSDAVLQLHVPRSQWINNHKYCLHLWRPLDAQIPMPPTWMVGIKELDSESLNL